MYVAVVLFVVDQAKVKFKGANQSIRDKPICITYFQFSDIVKQLFRVILKIKEEHLKIEEINGEKLITDFH